MRVSELAKELGLTSKEVIEKFAQVSIVVKTHSSSVTPEQIKKLKEFINSKVDNNFIYEYLLGKKVYLELYVKTIKNWRDKDKYINEFGFNETE